MNYKTECIDCYERKDYTENICQKCLFKLYDKADKLKEIEGRGKMVNDKLDLLKRMIEADSWTFQFNCDHISKEIEEIKKLLEDK